MASIVSFASGKGGVGKSTTVSNLGLLFARRGLSVVLIDLDAGGAGLHVLFGEVAPPLTLSDFLARRAPTLAGVASAIPWCPRLRLIDGTGETLSNPAGQTKRRLERQVRGLDADLILLDIGAGTNQHAVDFFSWGDVCVAVTTPEPSAVLDLYKLIKLAATRRVLAAFASREPVGETLLGEDSRPLQQLMAAASEAGPEAERAAREALASMRVCMLLNQAGSDDRVGAGKLRAVMHRFLGSEVFVLGQIPSDPAVTQSIRRRLPVVDSAPNSPAARAFESACDALLRELPGLARVSQPVPTTVGAPPLSAATSKIR